MNPLAEWTKSANAEVLPARQAGSHTAANKKTDLKGSVFFIFAVINDSKNPYYGFKMIKPVTTFCQVFKVEICEANTTVT